MHELASSYHNIFYVYVKETCVFVAFGTCNAQFIEKRVIQVI